ncbi:MAG: glycosyltransferase [Gammaproteobacteria bacterium]|nr:glycosyltransferase [Gammaproteobacteria bacterium]
MNLETNHTPPIVSVVILSYNRPEYTNKTLKSITSIAAGIPFELIVVDNGSEPDAVDLLKRWEELGKIDKLILLPSNLGTSPGYNKGFSVADERSIYLCKLDNDICVLSENWLQEIVSVIEDEYDVGICATEIANHKGINQAPIIQLGSGHKVKCWSNFQAGGGGMTFSKVLYYQLGTFKESYADGLKLMPDDIEFYLKVHKSGLRSYYACDAQSVMQLDYDYTDYKIWKKRQYHLLKTRFFRVANGQKQFKPYIAGIEFDKQQYVAGTEVVCKVSIACSSNSKIGIGMSIQSHKEKSPFISDPSGDIMVCANSGHRVYLRQFTLPEDISSGNYKVILSLSDGWPGSGVESFDQYIEVNQLTIIEK